MTSELDKAAEEYVNTHFMKTGMYCSDCYKNGIKAGFMLAIETAEKNKFSAYEDLENIIFVDDLKQFAGVEK
jgi:hypothetical protein